MSKLTHVRKALQDNPDITIVGAPVQNYLPGRNGYWSHTVDFHVAPKTGGVYTAEELQALMMSLVPGLEPTSKDNFYECDRQLNFGKLYFDEDIGTESVRREIVLTDEDMLPSDGFVDGKQVIERTKKVERRIWVCLFPDVQTAAVALVGENQFHISKDDLSRHRGILAQIANPTL